MSTKAVNKIYFIFCLLVIGSSSSCSNDSSKERVKLQQYIVQGKGLYLKHCVNCHQPDGKGFAQLYPPLSKADFLLENIPRAACIIKHGQIGEIYVNGNSYNQQMPAFTELTNLEIAELLTYISNSWENDKGLQTVSVVESWLETCK